MQQTETATSTENVQSLDIVRIVANNIISQEFKSIAKRSQGLYLPLEASETLRNYSLEDLADLASIKGLTTEYFKGLHLARLIGAYGANWREHCENDSRHLDATIRLVKKYAKAEGKSLELLPILSRFLSKDKYRPAMNHIYCDGASVVATDGYKLATFNQDWGKGYYVCSGADVLPFQLDETYPAFRNVIPSYSYVDVVSKYELGNMLSGIYLAESRNKMLAKYKGYGQLVTVYSNVLTQSEIKTLGELDGRNLFEHTTVNFKGSGFAIEHIKPVVEYAIAYMKVFNLDGIGISQHDVNGFSKVSFFNCDNKECIALVMPLRVDEHDLSELPVIA